MTALVACQGEQDDPFALVAEERSHAVLSHIRSYGERVNVIFAEESAGIHCRCIADVATFCVGNDEVVGVIFLQVVDGLLESHQSLHAESLVESEVGLVSHAVRCGGVDDGLVEGEDGVWTVEQVLWHLFEVGIETYAEKRALGLNLFYQLLSIHVISLFLSLAIR